MFIKMRTTSAGPEGARISGRVYNVPDAEAQGLIDSGAAEEVKNDKEKETATETRVDVERAAEGQRVNKVVDRYRKTPA